MVKRAAILIMAAAAAVLCGCKELARTNPTDPQSGTYIGITYKGETWYPMDTDVTAMAVVNGTVTLGAYNPSDGDCIIRLTGASSYVKEGSTGDVPGTFRSIQDICADSAGNIYVADYKDIIQCVSPSGTFTSWPINHTANIDKLSIECLNDVIYVSNGADRTVISYSTAGAQADSAGLSFTSYGEFIPGRIWSSSTHVYVANALDKSVVVQFTPQLSQTAVYDFQAEVADGCAEGAQMELCTPQAMYRTDSFLAIVQIWGNYGVGPGKVLNGRLTACDPLQKYVYVMDGDTIKYFGE